MPYVDGNYLLFSGIHRWHKKPVLAPDPTGAGKIIFNHIGWNLGARGNAGQVNPIALQGRLRHGQKQRG